MVKLKFLLDENISHRLFSLLKKKKYNVESVQSLNLCGITNGDLLLKALQTQRILVTFDKDFLKFSNKPHSGMLIINIHPARDSFVIPVFESFLENSEILALDWTNKIVILKVDSYEIK
ncbi:MAG: DUF5615 family PIN-like protein [Promethearchaeota archaeon]